jgi:hypothetical protein
VNKDRLIDIAAALIVGLLVTGVTYFYLNYHPVYSKSCTVTPDGVKCPLDHYEKNN